MADTYKKISDFTKATAFGDDDLLLVSQSGTTKAIKGSVLKAFATAAGIDAAKINDATVNGSGHLIIKTTDGTSIDVGKVTGSDGVSVTGASIDAQYHLILTLSDGTTKDAGYCRGASGSGTGDMLKETYDEDGAVEAAGGISSFFDSKYSDKYYDDKLMSQSSYDPDGNIEYQGGITSWAHHTLCLDARDRSEPVGTIRTTVRKKMNDAWKKCDGSELSFSDSPILWQHMNSGLSFTQGTTTVMNYVSGLSDVYWADAVKFGVCWYIAFSGISGSNAVLYIFKTQDSTFGQRWSLVKTYSVSASSGTYPCTLGLGTDSETNESTLMVMWTVDDTKIYYTTDGDTWSEKTGHGLSEMSGHEIQMTTIGNLTGFLMCDKTACELYILNSLQGAFQTMVENPEAFEGRTTTAISVSNDGHDIFIARSMEQNSNSDRTTIMLHHAYCWDLSNAEWEQWWGEPKLGAYISNSRHGKELSNVCYDNTSGLFYLAFTQGGTDVTVATFDGNESWQKEWDINVLFPDGATSIKHLILSSEAGAVLRFQCQKNSEDRGGMYIRCGKYEPFTEIDLGEFNDVACTSPSLPLANLGSTGLWYEGNIYDETITLPNISLGDGTTTYIKVKDEQRWTE